VDHGRWGPSSALVAASRSNGQITSRPCA